MKLPSPATLIATLALFVALGGTSYAVTALPNNSVGSPQIKPGAIKIGDISASAQKALAGTAGTAGTPGANGAAGPVGADGSAGAPGAKGDTGDTGAGGNSDLAGIAVRNGYLMTKGAYLSNALLAGQDLTDLNLATAVLTGAVLSNATMLRTNLTGARIGSGDNANWTNLSGADLTGAILVDTYLDRTNLANADLTGANLSVTTGQSLYLVDFTDADLTDANLTNRLIGPSNDLVWSNTTCPDGTNSGTGGAATCIGHLVAP